MAYRHQSTIHRDVPLRHITENILRRRKENHLFDESTGTSFLRSVHYQVSRKLTWLFAKMDCSQGQFSASCSLYQSRPVRFFLLYYLCIVGFPTATGPITCTYSPDLPVQNRLDPSRSFLPSVFFSVPPSAQFFAVRCCFFVLDHRFVFLHPQFCSVSFFSGSRFPTCSVFSFSTVFFFVPFCTPRSSVPPKFAPSVLFLPSVSFFCPPSVFFCPPSVFVVPVSFC